MPDVHIERAVVTGGRDFTDKARIEADFGELIKLGDNIAWEIFAERPDLLVRLTLLGHEYGRRRLVIGHSDDGCGFRFAGERGDFDGRHIQKIEVVAIGVPPCDQAELDRLAEVFEIREYLMASGDDSIWFDEDIDTLAPRLQAAGYRLELDGVLARAGGLSSTEGRQR